MLEEFCKQVINKSIKTELPHLELPAVMYAKVTKSTELSDEYEFKVSCEDSDGEAKEHICKAKYYSYNLKILDKNKAVNSTYPEITAVRSRGQFKAGDVVAIALVCGELMPFILGGAG